MKVTVLTIMRKTSLIICIISKLLLEVAPTTLATFSSRDRKL